MADRRYLVDTNILIRWIRRDAIEFETINNTIQSFARRGEVPVYTSQNLGEFWNVLTRPVDRNGYGLTALEADERAREIETSLELLPDTLAVHLEWRRLLVEYGVRGVQVHDARLAATMRVHGVKRILTFNTRDFARFEAIEAVHPGQLS